jgi:lysozyme|tara:strand:+ start:1732 stop:2124 length:393 start_codon:yes stop_codon:yes gene_type:complete
MSEMLDRVMVNEGFEAKPYQDTLGIWTIGHGLTYLTSEESRAIVASRLHDLGKQLIANKPWLEGYPTEVCEIVTEMCFQMGPSRTYKFTKMFAALQQHDFREAAAQMRDSNWNKQTPERCERMAKRMEMV